MKNTSKIKIKTKETIHDVKTKDSKQNLKYFMKDVAVHEKEKIKDNNAKSKMIQFKTMHPIEWSKYKKQLLNNPIERRKHL